MEMRTCRLCHARKPIEQFRLCRTYASAKQKAHVYRRNWCLPCEKEWIRQHRHKQTLKYMRQQNTEEAQQARELRAMESLSGS